MALIPVVAVIVAFRHALGSELGFFYRDHSLFFRPEWWSIYTQLQEGTLPVLSLAHPDGQPHEYSTNYALFTPLTLILLLGPFAHTYDFFVVAHFAVLAAGAYVLIRDEGGGSAAALLGGVVAALIGPVISFDSLLVGLLGLAYAPWIWWALLRLLREPSGRNVSLLAFLTAFGVQGVMPEVLLLHAAVGVISIWHARPSPVGTVIMGLCGAGVLAGLIASVDIVPQLDALSGSRRWLGFDAVELEGWSFGPYQLVELIAPAFFASPNLYFFNVPSATGSTIDPPYLPTLYLGTVFPLVLAAPVLDGARARVATILALFFALVATGPATPLHGVLTSLPLLRSSRFAIKYLVLAVPMLVYLTVLGLNALRSGRRWRFLLIASGLHVSVVGGLFGWLQTSGARDWLAAAASPFRSATPFDVYREDVVGMALQEMNSSVGHSMVFALLLLALAGLGARLPRLHARLASALVVLVGLDLGLAVGFGIPLGPTHATALPEDIISVLTRERETVMVGAPRSVPHLEGQTCFQDHLVNHGRHGLLAWEYFRSFDSNDLEGLAQNPVHSRVRGWLDGLSSLEAEALLTRAGVRYLIGTRAEIGTELVVFTDHVNRRLSLSEITARDDGGTQLSPSWFGLSLTSTSAREIFTDSTRLEQTIIWAETEPSDEDTTCEPQLESVETERSGQFRFRTSSRCPAMLVLPEIRYPRWRGRLDGAPVDILLADAGFMAVRVPPGEHEVLFDYDSLTRRWLGVSLTAALFCLGLLAMGSRRRQSRPKQ